MDRRQEERIDFLLGELEPGLAEEVARRVELDPQEAAASLRLERAAALIREAAAEGWPAPTAYGWRALMASGWRVPMTSGWRVLGPGLAAAAVIALAVAAFMMREEPQPDAIYEPDLAFGYLLPEETDSGGRMRSSVIRDHAIFRGGLAELSVIGSERGYPLGEGDIVAPNSELRTPADSGARINLPYGGMLFVGPLSTVRLRDRKDGHSAIRLMAGVACTVAGDRPLHIGVEGSDLILRQPNGAALVQHSPGQVVCLRGDLWLDLGAGERFRIPPGRRIPAACANAPRTVTVTDDDLDLDWYRSLVYREYRSDSVTWERPGEATLRDVGPETLLYLEIRARESAEASVSFGAGPRLFALAKDRTLRLRLRLADLGPGPHLSVEPAKAIQTARLLVVR